MLIIRTVASADFAAVRVYAAARVLKVSLHFESRGGGEPKLVSRLRGKPHSQICSYVSEYDETLRGPNGSPFWGFKLWLNVGGV